MTTRPPAFRRSGKFVPAGLPAWLSASASCGCHDARVQMIADPDATLKRGRSMLEVAVGGLAAQPAVASAQTVLEPKRVVVFVAAAADTGKHSTLEEIPPGLPRRFVRTPYFAPDGPDPPAETPARTAVGHYLLARRCCGAHRGQSTPITCDGSCWAGDRLA